jgi:Uma2 family endonuclease
MATRVVLTYADYAAIPADGKRYELHDGELWMTPAPGTRHQRVVGALFALLRGHATARGLGEVFLSPIDCILSDTSVVQPDLAYLDPGRRGAVSERGIEGAPTLVVEVLSPSTAQLDRGVKAQLYARHRVPCYWIVDPEHRAIEAFELAGEGYRPAGRLEGPAPAALPPFPDLGLDPAAVWPAP